MAAPIGDNAKLVDTLSKAERSERMRRVRNKDSRAELRVRKIVHSMGYRYRLHSSKLPGKPDLVFTARQKVIFVHGCFWHRHDRCKLARMPKSRLSFWRTKLEKNRQRDRQIQVALNELGWDYLVIWECESNEESAIREKVGEYLA